MHPVLAINILKITATLESLNKPSRLLTSTDIPKNIVYNGVTSAYFIWQLIIDFDWWKKCVMSFVHKSNFLKYSFGKPMFDTMKIYFGQKFYLKFVIQYPTPKKKRFCLYVRIAITYL